MSEIKCRPYFSLKAQHKIKKKIRNSSLWTCGNIVDISRSQNKNDDFGLTVSL